MADLFLHIKLYRIHDLLTTDATPSLFRRFVNMFTPKEQRIRLEEDEENNVRSEPTKVAKARRRIANQNSSRMIFKRSPFDSLLETSKEPNRS